MVSTLLRDRDGVLWAGTWEAHLADHAARRLVVVFTQRIGR
jgi:hypothetical protein